MKNALFLSAFMCLLSSINHIQAVKKLDISFAHEQDNFTFEVAIKDNENHLIYTHNNYIFDFNIISEKDNYLEIKTNILKSINSSIENIASPSIGTFFGQPASISIGENSTNVLIFKIIAFK